MDHIEEQLKTGRERDRDREAETKRERERQRDKETERERGRVCMCVCMRGGRLYIRGACVRVNIGKTKKARYR